MADFPTVLQPSSTCQGFRLLTVSCQRFTNQPIVFCVVRPTLNSLALAKRAVSLFPSRAAALVSRVSQLRRSRARALLSLNLKKKRHRSQSKGRYTPKGICLSGWRCVNKTVIRKNAVLVFCKCFQRILNRRSQRPIDLRVFIFEYNREIMVEYRFGARPIF